VTLQKMASLVDGVLYLVLGEKFVTPMEQAVVQYPFLIHYYLRGI